MAWRTWIWAYVCTIFSHKAGIKGSLYGRGRLVRRVGFLSGQYPGFACRSCYSNANDKHIAEDHSMAFNGLICSESKRILKAVVLNIKNLKREWIIRHVLGVADPCDLPSPQPRQRNKAIINPLQRHIQSQTYFFLSIRCQLCSTRLLRLRPIRSEGRPTQLSSDPRGERIAYAVSVPGS